MTELLAAIDAPHFYAGIVLKNDRVVVAAHVVRYMGGWSRDKVREYCREKGWKVTVVSQLQEPRTRGAGNTQQELSNGDEGKT